MVSWAIVLIYVILIAVVCAIIFVIWLRKARGKQAQIQDLRNPRKEFEKYYFINDKAAGLIKLYSNVITPIKSGILPPIDLRPFIYWDGKIYGVRGATGNAEDDSIALLRRPMVSMVEASEQAKGIADAVKNTFAFYDSCRKFRVGEEVKFDFNQDKVGVIEYNGVISAIGFGGLEILVANNVEKEVETIIGGQKQKQRKSVVEYSKYLFENAHDVKEAHIVHVGDTKTDTLKETGLDAFYTPKWVLTHFGVTPVDDANPILTSQKEFIAEFNSKINDKMNARKSWFEKNQAIIMIMLFGLGLAIAFAIESYATQQYVSGVIGKAGTQINTLLQIANATKAAV